MSFFIEVIKYYLENDLVMFGVFDLIAILNVILIFYNIKKKGTLSHIARGIMTVSSIFVVFSGFCLITYIAHYFLDYISRVVFLSIVYSLFGLLTWYVLFSKHFHCLSDNHKHSVVSIYILVSFLAYIFLIFLVF